MKELQTKTVEMNEANELRGKKSKAQTPEQKAVKEAATAQRAAMRLTQEQKQKREDMAELLEKNRKTNDQRARRSERAAKVTPQQHQKAQLKEEEHTEERQGLEIDSKHEDAREIQSKKLKTERANQAEDSDTQQKAAVLVGEAPEVKRESFREEWEGFSHPALRLSAQLVGLGTTVTEKTAAGANISPTKVDRHVDKMDDAADMDIAGKTSAEHARKRQ
jgi:hypothetical protein